MDFSAYSVVFLILLLSQNRGEYYSILQNKIETQK
jgi:hypothetical protein